MKQALCLFVGLASVLMLTAACTDFGYVLQCARGHWGVVSHTRPIADLLADPATSQEQRLRLARVLEMRAFAVDNLGLPDNGSYRSYADIGRPYVVWNVVAAPEFSLEPRQWCFPVAGCVAYRGYFDEATARDYAQQLQAEGFEVDVYGVQAYSTLSWFDDPVLNTFLADGEAALAGLIFHELAHQVYYLADDSRFNEAFAKTVELEGLRRWMKVAGDESSWREYREREQRIEEFVELLMQTRSELDEIYRRSVAVDVMRVEKGLATERLQARYRELKDSWAGYDGFDRWFERGVNNARLASLATYHDLVPAFQGLLEQQGGSLSAFYERVRELGRLPKDERQARLNQYLSVRQALLTLPEKAQLD